MLHFSASPPASHTGCAAPFPTTLGGVTRHISDTGQLHSVQMFADSDAHREQKIIIDTAPQALPRHISIAQSSTRLISRWIRLR